MSTAQDLRQRRASLQIELLELREQHERASRENSYAKARERAGVSRADSSELKRLADDEVARTPAIAGVRREIESIDAELAQNHPAGLAESGRRMADWLQRSRPRF